MTIESPAAASAEASTARAIEVSGLRKSYGALVAVDGISFTVAQNEIFGLLGPNGAGKTTTVEILEGLRGADSGEVTVAGVDVRRDPERVKALIGVQLQSSAFLDNLQLAELIPLFASFYGRRVDPQARRNLWDLVQTLRSQGRSIVLTTHYMEEAEALCDRVAIMDHGRILQLDTPDNLIQRLLDKGFRRAKVEREANLEDVFIDLTGHELREG